MDIVQRTNMVTRGINTKKGKGSE